MDISVEISMYPLQDNYKEKIKAFIAHLESSAVDVEIRTSNMSTRLFGQFEDVTALLNSAMAESMARYGKIVFVCKYLEGDARELQGYS